MKFYYSLLMGILLLAFPLSAFAKTQTKTCTAYQLDGTAYTIVIPVTSTCPEYMQCVVDGVTVTVLKNPTCPTSISHNPPA